MLLCLTPGAVAQISLGPAGVGPLTFDTTPTVAEGWSTVAVIGGAGDFTITGALDASVIANANAATITNGLPASLTVPPSQNALARHNTTGLYLQTRPTGNAYLMLMATLRNDTGGNVGTVTVSYDWNQLNPIPVNESIAGHRAFWSLTGAPGSWTLIPEFSVFDNNSAAQNLSATLALGNWPASSNLYLIWADDNGPGSIVDPQEGAYTIDNFTVAVQTQLTLLSATILPDQDCNLRKVELLFSKPVTPGTATNTANYSLPGLAIARASHSALQPHRVVLDTAPLTCGFSYTLNVMNLQDGMGQFLTPNPSSANLSSDMIGCCGGNFIFPLVAGYNAFTYPMQSPGYDVATILPDLPDGTVLQKWDPSVQSFLQGNLFDGLVGWDNPAMTLLPGEGAYLILPMAFNLVRTGFIPVAQLPPNLVPGVNFVGRQIPYPGNFTQVTGFAPTNGVLVNQYNPMTGQFNPHFFRQDHWDGGPPLIRPAEAVFINFLASAEITTQPQSQTNLNPGTNITLSVIAGGSEPITYQWRLNGENIPDATNSTLVLMNVQPADSGNYSVGVANPVSATNSAIAQVRVNAPFLQLADNFAAAFTLNAPNFLGRGHNLGATIEAGEPNHAGRPPRSSVWLNWVAPLNPGIATFSVRGSSFDTRLAAYSGSSLIALTPVAADDDRGGFHTSLIKFNVTPGATYRIAVDSLFNEQGDIVLGGQFFGTMNVLPVITTQPSGRVVLPGGNAAFSVVAAGAGLTYQWFFNSTPLPGETQPDLVRNNVQPPDVGTYHVLVTRGVLTVDSDRAALQINTEGDNHLARDKYADAVADAEGLSPPGLLGDKSALAGLPRRKSLSIGITDESKFFNSSAKTKDPEEPNHCGKLGGASELYVFTVAQAGRMHLTTDGSNFDTVMAVYRDPGAGLYPHATNVLTCDDNSGTNNLTSAMSLDVQTGTNYVLFVDDVAGVGGLVALRTWIEIPIQLNVQGYTNSICFCFKASGTAGRYGIVQASTNLTSWVSFQTNLFSLAGGTFTCFDTNAPAVPHRFYRALYKP